MPVASVDYRQGYANGGGNSEMVGAQSINGPWTPLGFGLFSGTASHIDTFLWESQNAANAPGTSYRYVAIMLLDSGGTINEVGCADLKWRNSGGTDIGPP